MGLFFWSTFSIANNPDDDISGYLAKIGTIELPDQFRPRLGVSYFTTTEVKYINAKKKRKTNVLLEIRNHGSLFQVTRQQLLTGARFSEVGESGNLKMVSAESLNWLVDGQNVEVVMENLKNPDGVRYVRYLTLFQNKNNAQFSICFTTIHPADVDKLKNQTSVSDGQEDESDEEVEMPGGLTIEQVKKMFESFQSVQP
jgi:hypothetical protein